jgi:hypothetical protein
VHYVSHCTHQNPATLSVERRVMILADVAAGMHHVSLEGIVHKVSDVLCVYVSAHV